MKKKRMKGYIELLERRCEIYQTRLMAEVAHVQALNKQLDALKEEYNLLWQEAEANDRQK